MTHYDIDYSKLSGVKRHAKAIQDIKDYIGKDRFKHLTKILVKENLQTLDEYKMALSFAGIHGYPCEAWMHHVQAVQFGATS